MPTPSENADSVAATMFRNLSTSTKLIVLCGAFIVAIAVAIYALVAEQQIAIEFAKKELTGVQYIEAVRGVYSRLLGEPENTGVAGQALPSAPEVLSSLNKAEAEVNLNTASLAQSLANTLSRLWSDSTDESAKSGLVGEALVKSRDLISRVGDDSNLALDPDLDSYYLQDTLVRQMPRLLGEIGDVSGLIGASSVPSLSSGDKTRLFASVAMARSTAEEIARNLTSAYRGDSDGTLRRKIEAPMAVMLSSVTSYLGALDDSFDDAGKVDQDALGDLRRSAANDAIDSWAGGLDALRGLLKRRIDGLNEKLYRSLLLTGALAAISILLAFLTHRHIVQPLGRLEGLARRVRETGNYSHRVNDTSKDEVGRLAGAFDDMLGELDTAHKREVAERAEQAANERLSVLLNASPAVIYCRSAAGDYQPTYVSESISGLFGCTPREYLQNPYLWRDHVHPDDVPRIAAWVDRMFENDRRSIEYRIRRPDGSYFWVDDRQQIVRDADGKPIEIVGSWTDVTARKEAEETRERVRARLDLLLSAAPAVIYSFAASGDFAPTFVSDNIASLFGYRPEEYLKDAAFWRAHVHPDDLAVVEADQAQLFEAGAHSSEYRFRKKDGSYCWVSDEQHLIKDAHGQPSEIVGSWSDITGRKQAEASEDAARARLSALLESAPAVIYSFKASGDYAPTFVSENIKRLLGYCPEKYLEHADFWRNNVHPEDLPSVEAEQTKLFEKGRHTAEYRFRKRNGNYIWVSDEQYLLRGDDGQPAEVVGSWSNILCAQAGRAGGECVARALRSAAPWCTRGGLQLRGRRQLCAHLRQREHQARAGLRARPISEGSRVLALPRASRGPSWSGGRASQTL